jgi:hypothetical protein
MSRLRLMTSIYMRTQRFLWILDDMAAVSRPVTVATRPHAKAAQLSTKKQPLND